MKRLNVQSEPHIRPVGRRRPPATERAMRWVLIILLAVPATTTPATITVDEATCTLVDAITAANADVPVGGCVGGDPGLDTIELMTDVVLAEEDNDEFGDTGLPVVRTDITVEANGHTIEIGGFLQSFRFFAVSPDNPGGVLTLRSATLSGGLSSTSGGAIWLDSQAHLVLEDSVIRDSRSYGDGGGIYARDNTRIVLENSTIAENRTYPFGDGGGLWAGFGSTLVVRGSTIRDNTTSGYTPVGGGVFFDGDSVTLTDSIVSGNRGRGGGGLSVGRNATAMVTNSTISSNQTVSSSGKGGGPSRGGERNSGVR